MSCGDFAECFPLDDERHAIIIGDVAGRGPAAGAAGRALLELARIAVTSREPLRSGLAMCDDIFTSGIMSAEVPIASLFLAVADVKDGALEYASAGHEPALHFTSRTRHEHLFPSGPLLGLDRLSNAGFTQRRVQFGPESVLAIVTDGITESRCYEGGAPRFFGGEGVARALVSARRRQADPACAIADAAAAHCGGRRLDDATALVLELGRFSPAESLLSTVFEASMRR